ncbi:sulfotransferase [Methylophaga thiooxydans]|uniref:sulfotransferase n=1 Tax=Methylophaga thiooxydans TaxID=392484 RepID=UPI002352DDDD|nr:sulfotransferase [Methylophaga thiooxydans]
MYKLSIKKTVIKKFVTRVLAKIKGYKNRLLLTGRRKKIFCIGLNKTGTTSVKKAFKDLGFVVGDQGVATELLQFWIKRDFRPIVKYCRTAEAFQDSPFSYPYTYVALDQAFPGSKFILTIRDNPEQWYNSITKFHGKRWANGRIPTKSDLKRAIRETKGRPWVVNRALFDTPEDDPYRKAELLQFYNRHIEDVTRYFKSRPNDLLVINLSEEGAYQKFIEFLGVESLSNEFPWENRT